MSPTLIPHFRHLKNWVSSVAFLISCIGFSPTFAQPISFSSSGLNGESLNNPTSLDFGPDDRLYVSQQNGTINIYTIDRTGDPGNGVYTVTATETINVQSLVPNHNDDGTSNTTNQRQVTGLLVIGTATNPVLYVSSSDWRIAVGNDTGLDTNSGVISCFTCPGGVVGNTCVGGWDRVDIVRGLSRCEENHSINGLDYDPTTNTLFCMVGGNANKGAPSNNFSGTPEYWTAGVLLSIDLDEIDNLGVFTDQRDGTPFVYDMPTFNDPSRADIDNTHGDFPYASNHPLYNATIDIGDPFGGNNSLNQAITEPGGPVQLYADDFRNAYDVVFTESGKLYTSDNGPNGGWGGLPIIRDANDNIVNFNNETQYNNALSNNPDYYITNEFNESVSNGHGDPLFLLTPGFSGGHPAPIRANPAEAGIYEYEEINGTWTEVSSHNVPDLINGVQGYYGTLNISDYPTANNNDKALYKANDSNKYIDIIGASTNGITEYTASNFGGAMQGDILTASFNENIYRYKMNAAGDAFIEKEAIFNGFGNNPLDVTAQSDSDIFPGTIWAATYGSNNITVFEPTDFGNCPQPGDNDYDPNADSDGDMYTNQDEVDNGTNHCSSASKPTDNDGDFISDLNDTDDDNDLILDINDEFALDANNGTTTNLPIIYEFTAGSPGTGLFGLGFTGLMKNDATDYLDQFDDANLAAGGAGGKLTVEGVTAGDAFQTGNDQEFAFQFGVNVNNSSNPFTVHTRLDPPYFGGATPINFQSFGIQIGKGDQDNYLKFVLNAQGGSGGLQLLLEDAGSVTTLFNGAIANILNAGGVDLYISVEPSNNTAKAFYSLDAGNTVTQIGAVNGFAIPMTWLDGTDDMGLAVGTISTSFNSGTPFDATWDFIKVTEDINGEFVADPTALNFDIVQPGSSSTLFLNVTNLGGPGANDIEVSALNFIGTDNGDFSSTTSTPFTVAPGNTEVIEVSFSPTVTGNKSANLSIVHNGNNPPLVVPLTGESENVNPIFRVNTGGPQIASIDGGIVWEEDTPANPHPHLVNTGSNQASGFGMNSYTQQVDLSTTPTSVYDTERYDGTMDGNGEMQYSFPVDQVAEYEVRLYIGNGWPQSSGPGQRIFNVELEGSVPANMTNIDLSADPGHQIGTVFTNTVTVTDGSIDIEFIHNVQNPIVNAIEILGPPQGTPILVDNIPDQTNFEGDMVDLTILASGGDDNLSYSVSGLPPGVQLVDPTNGLISGTISAGAASGSPYTVDVTVDDSDGDTDDAVMTSFIWNVFEQGTLFSIYRVNTGGASIPATDAGEDWGTDTQNSPSPYLAAISSGNSTFDLSFNTAYDNPITTDGSVPMYVPTSIFETERYDAESAPEMLWQFEVAPGSQVQINLFFSEMFNQITAPNQRQFDVSVEGVVPPEFEDIDPYEETGGGNIGFMKSYTLTGPADGIVDIEAIHDIQNPAFKGIEVLSDQLPPMGEPSAFIQVNPGGNLGASTFGGGSFSIQNTGDVDIDKITFDLSTGFLMDVVFDPVGTAGDAGAKCFEADSGANETGLTTDGSGSGNGSCVDPFSQPHNGADNAEGYDILTIEFNDFNGGETFAFSVDNDPTSIKGQTGTGEAGSISGLEMISATVTIEFANGETLVTTLFEEGSLGGSNGTAAANAPATPSIAVQGVPNTPAVVTTPNQIIEISGPANADFTLMQVDARLYINDAQGGYDIDPFEANDAMAKVLYTGTLDANGFATVPVTLLQTASGDGGPDGGINHFVAVIEGTGEQNSSNSNTIILEYDPNAVVDLVINPNTFDFVLEQDQMTTDAYIVTTSDNSIFPGQAGIEIIDDATQQAATWATTVAMASQDVSYDLNIDATGLTPGIYTATMTANSISGYNPGTATITLEVTQPAATALFRVNTGGTEITATDNGPDWTIDTEGNNSMYLIEPGSNDAGGFSVTPGITVPAYVPADVFLTERYDAVNNSPEEMLWEFPIATPTKIQLNLLFGNGFGGTSGTGARVFDVAVEGEVPAVYDDIDLSDLFGHQIGGMLSYEVDVIDGSLSIEFLHDIMENPMINAIEVIDLGPPSNFAPQIDPIADFQILEGEVATTSINVTDVNLDITTITIEVVDDATTQAVDPINYTFTDNGDNTASFSWTTQMGDAGSYTATVTADDGNDTDTESFAITVEIPLTGTIIARVNAGGVSVMADDSGPDWEANAVVGATSGPSYSVNTGNVSTPDPVTRDASIPDYITPSVFNSIFEKERWDPGSGPEMEWTFDVCPGDYEVRLYMGDGYSGSSAVGDRFFDISVEGILVFDNLDLIADVGDQVGAMYRYIIPSSVVDGSINILFEHEAGGDNPLINGIEIVELGTSSNAAPVVNITNPASVFTGDNITSINFTATSTDSEEGDLSAGIEWTSSIEGVIGTGASIDVILSEGTHVITASSTDCQGLLGDDAISGTVDNAFFSCNVLYRINNGGAATTAVDGQGDWAVDTNGDPSTFRTSGGENVFNVNANTTIDLSDPSLIGSAITESMMRFERFDLDNNNSPNPMKWEFPVAAGTTVEIRLYFAELFFDAVDERVFDISVEGTVPPVFDDIDQVAIAGTNFKAFMLSHMVTVDNNDMLDLEFLHGSANNPAIKAIEICEITNAPAVTIVSPQDGANLTRGDNAFEATATDVEDDDATLTAGLNWSANNDNGVSGTGGTPTLSLSEPGLQIITAEVTDSDGNPGSASISVNVSGPAVNITSPMEGAELTSTDVTIDWEAFDVFDNDGEHFHIYVNEIDPMNPDPNNRISTANVNGARTWDLTAADGLEFGDNVLTIRIARPGHIEFENVEAIDIVNFTIVDPGMPSASFTVSPEVQSCFDEITFNGSSSSHTGDANIVLYEWDFDYDGNTFDVDATGISTTHTYNSFGDYNVALRVTDDNNPAQVDIEIVALSLQSIEPISVPGGPYSITIGDDLQLDGSGSSDPDAACGDAIASFAWDLNDDEDFSDASGATPSITAQALADLGMGVGQHTITLLVTDNGGLTHEATTTLDIQALSLASAYVAINPGAGIGASTFSGGFIVKNNSDPGVNIEKVELSINTALYPDMAFDPLGTAGDATGKCLDVVSNEDLGLLNIDGNGGDNIADPDCSVPFSDPIGNGGFQSVSLDFNGFNPGETLNFALDVDPITIENASGTGSSGSVSGLELTGSIYTITFDNGQVLSGEIYRVQDSSNGGAENDLTQDPISNAPGLTVLGLTPVTSPNGYQDAEYTAGEVNQTAQISGPANANVSLLVIESALLLNNPVADPFEANEAQVIAEYDAVIGTGGTIDIPITLTDNASGNLYYLTAVIVEPDGRTSATSEKWRLKEAASTVPPSALVQVNPGSGLGASTFGNNSFIINNTGGPNIVSVTFDISSNYLPDIVFDPNGNAGDVLAKCLTPGNGAAATGFITPGDPCNEPFDMPFDGGYFKMDLAFNDFNGGESFSMSVDIDPTSIQGDPGSGDAGAVSGFELIGSKITITFDDGSTLTGSLFDEGSMGGSDALIVENTIMTPSIDAVGLATPTATSNPNQIIEITGTSGDEVTLLQVDGRLFVDGSGHDIDQYEANEAMTKVLYTDVIGPNGTVQIPVTLMMTDGSGSTPDGGINHFIAMVNGDENEEGCASNTVVIEYDPNLIAMQEFVLIDANSDQPVQAFNPLFDGAVIPVNQALDVNIEAITNPMTVGSVVFDLDGPVSTSTTESVPPYALFGDNGNGDFTAQDLPEGDYTLTATPFTGGGGSGEAGLALTISFTVGDIPVDIDGDGFFSNEDCDDNNPNIYPGAPEDCDGVDNNCDGQVDEGLVNTYYADVDGDGFGNPNSSVDACSQPAGFVMDNTDCNDNNDSAYPGAPEVCDGVDNNCDGNIDEGLVIDVDGDGFPAANSPCGDGPFDCNDEDDSIYPGAVDIPNDGIDQDCDGSDATSGVAIAKFVLINADTDQPVPGYDPLLNGAVLDINIIPSSLNIEAIPVSDDVESIVFNLTGPIDKNVTENNAPYALFGDNGGDFAGVGFLLGNYNLDGTPYDDNNANGTAGNTLSISFSVVDAPVDGDGDGFTIADGDCNDNDDSVYPGAPEVCDGVDNNCDGNIDEGLTTIYYPDGDGDGYGDPSSPLEACTPPNGYVTNGLDCNDNDDTINPDATEVCDGVDNDCDGDTDEGFDSVTYYVDADGDGYGNPSISVVDCTPPNGYVTNGLDCNDNDDTINPDATEVCDGVDNDCDGDTDEGFDSVTYYVDADGDGYGNPSISVVDCTPPNGYVTNGLDCNDNDDTINPDATEVCDGVDNNCDGDTDEGFDSITYYADNDGDGFGNPGLSVIGCAPPNGFVDNDLDCNDNDDTINPNAVEVCDGVDNNCDGNIDEGLVVDNDGDGFPASNSPCGNGPFDCNDNDDTIYPGATEIPNNGVDEDCDGSDAVDGLSIANFTLIDADTDLPIALYDPLVDGAFLNTNSLPTDLAIQAFTNPTSVGSVKFELEGPLDWSSVETNAPYALFGDNGGDFNGQELDPGSYTLTATPFEGPGATGQAGTTKVINFTVGVGLVDNDGDGFTNDVDCNDNDDSVYPGAAEVCDGVDNNCDGNIDEGLVIDNDGDGFPASNSPCGNGPFDCNDNDDTIYPGAFDIPNNGIDEDCSGSDATGTGNLVDLELNVTANPELLIKFSTIDFTMTIENKGGVTATDIKVEVPIYKEEGLRETGNFDVPGGTTLSFVNNDMKHWNIPSLGAGQSLTLVYTLYVFSNDNPLLYFSEVLEASPNDVDSTPGNDTNDVADEDDETAVLLDVPSNMSQADLIPDERMDEEVELTEEVESDNQTEIIQLDLTNPVRLPKDLVFYPNPASNQLIVDLTPFNGLEGSYHITDMLGQLVAQQLLGEVSDRTVEIDLTNLKGGMYILNVKVGNHLYSKKFLIQR